MKLTVWLNYPNKYLPGLAGQVADIANQKPPIRNEREFFVLLGRWGKWLTA